MVRERHADAMGANPVKRNQIRAMLEGAAVAGVCVCALAGGGGCESGQKRDAAEMIDASSQSQSDGYELAREAQRLAEAGDTDMAIQTYQRALATWREMPAAWNNLGVLFMQQQNYADAVSAFKVAADQSQSDPRPLENIAVCYVRSGWATDALKYYGMSLERDPNRIESLRGAVRTAEMVRVRDDATLQRIRRALLVETDPTYREYFERQQQLVSAAIATNAP